MSLLTRVPWARRRREAGTCRHSPPQGDLPPPLLYTLSARPSLSAHAAWRSTEECAGKASAQADVARCAVAVDARKPEPEEHVGVHARLERRGACPPAPSGFTVCARVCVLRHARA
eukprot:616795-Rhodomonas_salina.1